MNFNDGNNMELLFSIQEKSRKRRGKRSQNNESFQMLRIDTFPLYSTLLPVLKTLAIRLRKRRMCDPPRSGPHHAIRSAERTYRDGSGGRHLGPHVSRQ